MENELWKPVPVEPFNEYYEISNRGRLRVLKGRQGTQKGKILKPVANRSTNIRYQYTFKAPGAQPSTQLVHRMVALAFIPNPDDLPEVNHKDGDGLNNCVDNLEWVTRQENMKQAWETGLMKRGADNHATKLTDDQIREIRRRATDEGESQRKLALEFGISASHCSNIVSGKARQYVD